MKGTLSFALIFLAGIFFLFNLRDLFITKETHKPIQLSTYRLEPKENKSFVILISSINNAKFCEKNLRSVFEQTYPHFRVIYIDDASTDGAFEKVEALVHALDQTQRVTLLRNDVPCGDTANYYRGIHLCQDEEIVLMLNGNDWLAHDQVLNWLNLCYHDPSIWMTYGSTCEYPSYRRSKANHAIPQSAHNKHNYRELVRGQFLIPHLKTAYAGLLKKVKIEEFQPIEALLIPAIELAKEHARYIRDILYIQNRQASHSIKQKGKKDFLNLPSYTALNDWREEK